MPPSTPAFSKSAVAAMVSSLRLLPELCTITDTAVLKAFFSSYDTSEWASQYGVIPDRKQGTVCSNKTNQNKSSRAPTIECAANDVSPRRYHRQSFSGGEGKEMRSRRLAKAK
jgi:hypothetical protein